MASADQTTNHPSEPAAQGGSSLIAVLRRRAWVVVLVTLLTGAAAAAFAYSNRDSYESTAKLLFRQTIGPELNAVGLQPGAPDADNLQQNNVELVSSRRVAAATARELGTRGVEASVDDVRSDVVVAGRKDSEVVDVTATADSPRGAALLASTYSRAAARFAQNDQANQAARVLASVTNQLNELSAEQSRGPAGRRLRTQAERLRTLTEVGDGSPRLIQPAFVPTEETGNPVQSILLGLLFGVVLGVALALLREQSDRRLHRAEEVSGAFGAPVLTTVPRHRALKKSPPFADLPPEVAEAFRQLQVNLRYRRGEPVRSVLVTSSRAREGKTTVAWNLAAAAASSGLAVALVEADMRRPVIAERYGLASEPGLAEVLNGELATAEALQSVGSLSGDGSGSRRGTMQVIVAGRLPHDPWALTQSAAMDRVMEALTRSHDLVVLDTPPIPHVADAVSLLRSVDGVIVTALLNKTREPDAERLRDQITGLGAPVLGIVVNGGSAVDGYAYLPGAPFRGDGDGRSRSVPDAPDYVTRR